MSAALTRRRFLVHGVGLTVLGAPLAALRSGGRAREEGERVLVVLQLTGGNDGLNTVVPFRQDAYFRLRPTLALPPGELAPLDDDHGLHPALGGIAELCREGRVAVLHGVASPHPDRSHFRSLEVWHTARPEGPPGELGWLGNLADQLVAAGEPMPALCLGDGPVPLSLRGERAACPSLEDPAGLRLDPRVASFGAARDALLDAPATGDLGFLREAARGAHDAAARMEELASRPPAVPYPDHALGRQLRLAASLIAGGFGTRVLHLELGGFDTHARQAPVQADLLGRLSGGLTAFQRDLEARGAADRVAVLVFSEFGRRAAENGSRGTDHGCGAPVLLMGSRVRGGTHGTPPDLAALVEGDVAPTTDFRAVYAALERTWMGLRSVTDVAPLDLFA